jgi:hypothetical protein
MAFESLIRRLQERIRSEPTVDMAICPPIRPRPPVSVDAVAAAEAQIGFPLPPLVRALYTQVADGGYGPGYGVYQLAGSELSLVECARWRGSIPSDSAGDVWWPPRLIELVGWGCHYASCIDCSRPSCPVTFYDNDRMAENATPADYLYPEADSLESWLSAWLDGMDLWATGPKQRRHAEPSAAADSIVVTPRTNPEAPAP